VGELLWFLQAGRNVRPLQEQGVHIWDAWAGPDGDLGPIYGVQWRTWGGDQLGRVVAELRRNPESRRLLVSAWNVEALESMHLPPCHVMFQFYVTPSPAPRLSCQVYQRSGDLFLGVPFNIASYALLTHMVAQVAGLGVGELVHVIGDAHIYLNHQDQVQLQLAREPLPLPRLVLDPGVSDLDGFEAGHIRLEGYTHGATIKGAVAV
jgi:thymidylate synthase